MIRQPKLEERNVTPQFYVSERKRIDKLNQYFGCVNLTKDEERVLLWLCGWDDYTFNNLISSLEKIKK